VRRLEEADVIRGYRTLIDPAAISRSTPNSDGPPIPMATSPARRNLRTLFGNIMWGGWGSNPRPADYEKYGFMHRAL
jgi:hypothetical protein